MESQELPKQTNKQKKVQWGPKYSSPSFLSGNILTVAQY